MGIPVAINRAAAFLLPATEAEGAAAMSAFTKLLVRFGSGVRVSPKDTAIILTQAEERAIFAGGWRLIFSTLGKVFVTGAVLDFVAGLVDPDRDKKTIATRLEIIEAQIVKGGPLWQRAIAIGEQIVFICLDGAGEVLGDALAGVLADLDPPQMAPTVGSNIWNSSAYVDLAPPIGADTSADSIFLAPGLMMRPALVPRVSIPVEFLPGPPSPSWGRRS